MERFSDKLRYYLLSGQSEKMAKRPGDTQYLGITKSRNPKTRRVEYWAFLKSHMFKKEGPFSTEEEALKGMDVAIKTGFLEDRKKEIIKAENARARKEKAREARLVRRPVLRMRLQRGIRGMRVSRPQRVSADSSLRR